jgi:hypothetical protein
MKKAIMVIGNKSKIIGFVGNVEVFSDNKEGSCVVVVEGAVFNDTVSELKKYFGAENVSPYACEVGDNKKADIIHNLTVGLAADKAKHFFV